ncbi:type I 3-dehydroquinate dehydratase [Clostridium sp. MD294]|uniref:type I 3-dehydroquinate dehydratase n=1 Tax=Clostridium sp. MD294 TaxID=97138 RepID=UPI0002CC6FEC|nr:type I 3-dehydroquinate dehydratase [Clostridium sp. MD294]NDO45614.1 type I 3-dehydroquinate dehydratase [Clostridium sp. MD294]USF30732.1 3-dehydroquinate dehydratase [Clostridium sp. MD294]
MKSVTIGNITIGEGIPKICVPIVGVTEQDILQQINQIDKECVDLIEWRCDWYEYCFDTSKVLQTLSVIKNMVKQIPILFTFRTEKEGGQKEISQKQYEALLLAVIKCKKVDMIDIELFTDSIVLNSLLQKAKQYAVKTIVSNHDFKKTPQENEIISRLCTMQKLGADITKIAVMPQNKKDVLTLLCATEQMQCQYADRPFVTMSMGNMGGISRIVGEIFGSAITFGAVQKSSAPGQIEAKKLKQLLQMIHNSMIEM